MAENNETPEKYITEEADAYLELGHLLKKDRPQEARARVLEILNRDISPEDKIRLINETDASENAQAEGGNAGIEPSKKRPVVLHTTAGMNLVNIKKNLKRTGLFTYIFIEWTNIRMFAFKTSILRSGFFRFQIAIKRNGWESIRKDASFAEGYIKYVLENGWMILDKFDYNLIALADRLFKEVLLVNITYFPNAEYILDKLKKVEMYFLACHYRQDYPERILESITAVLKYFNKPESKIQGISYFIKRFLFQTGDPVSLFNLLLAANMVRCRKYLTLYDLIQESQGGVVSNNIFECPDGVEIKIASFINENEMRLEQLQEEKKGLGKVGLFLKQFSALKTDGRGLAEYEALIMFYDSGTAPEKTHFLVDRDNLFVFGGNFIKRFIKEFEIFLNGKIKIEEAGEIQLFSYDFFVNNLGRMQSLLKAFGSLNMASLRINHSRLSEIKKDKSQAGISREEAEVVRFIDELSAVVLDIGKKTGHLALIYLMNSQEEQNEQIYQPIDLSFLSKNVFSVPFGDKKIVSPGYLNDKTFAEALSIIAGICYDMCRYMQNEEVVTYRENELSINSKIRKIRKILERVADPDTFERIKKVYGL